MGVASPQSGSYARVNPEPGKGRVNRYQLLEQIGQGGMAEVFRALRKDENGSPQVCVVKRIRADKQQSIALAQMLADEGRITSALRHPNIVAVYEHGTIDDQYMLAMEYLSGRDLATVLDSLTEQERPMPVEQALFVAHQVANGLSYAHALEDQDGRPLGLVHRDISPPNIMVLYSGGVKILDFGVAKLAQFLGEGRTIPGHIKGKRPYMAPEQLRSSRVDARTDVFALGIVLWEMLTGERLFSDPNPSTAMHNVLEKVVVAPSQLRAEVTPAVDAVVLRALARDPDQRFPSAGAFRRELGGFLRSTRIERTRLARLMGDLFPEGDEKTPVPSSAPESTTTLTGKKKEAVEPATPPLAPVPADAGGAPDAPMPEAPTGHTRVERRNKTTSGDSPHVVMAPATPQEPLGDPPSQPDATMYPPAPLAGMKLPPPVVSAAKQSDTGLLPLPFPLTGPTLTSDDVSGWQSSPRPHGVRWLRLLVVLAAVAGAFGAGIVAGKRTPERREVVPARVPRTARPMVEAMPHTPRPAPAVPRPLIDDSPQTAAARGASAGNRPGTAGETMPGDGTPTAAEAKPPASEAAPTGESPPKPASTGVNPAAAVPPAKEAKAPARPSRKSARRPGEPRTAPKVSPSPSARTAGPQPAKSPDPVRSKAGSPGGTTELVNPFR